jgi:phosphatidylglycerol lysyltransferase
MSHVPGGLGVFETVVVMLLGGQVDTQAIVGALVAFRAIYYFGPLAVAALLLGGYELRRQRGVLKRATALVDDWAVAVPHVLAFACFVSGAILLLSGATPALHHRLGWLERVLPLVLLETSHFVGSIVGAALVLLARDLQRRLDAAYAATVVLLTIGIVASLLKGFDWEEALVLAITLAAILPARREFYRTGALVGLRFTPAWGAGIAAVAIATVWLLFFAHRHVGYAHELWWQFEFHATAPRSMRATAGAMLVLLFVAVRALLRPVPPDPVLPTPDELARAEAIVATEPSTMGNLALLGDKEILFDDAKRAFLMYGVEGRSWVAMGDPVGLPAARAELAWRFRELTDRHDGYPVFYQVDAANLALYVDLGLTLTKLGEEARVPLPTFSLAGGSHKSLRQSVRRLADDGWTFRVAPPEEVAARMEELHAISDAWLGEKHTREKGFSLGFFAPDYLRRFPAALVEHHGTLAAFANVWKSAEHAELSIDLRHHRPDAPNGIMDFLFVNLFTWGRDEGYATFNLGMAPLSGLPDHALAPLWNRLGNLVFRLGEHFYNFQGLRAYKAKFDPVWAPRYLASPGGLALPRVLTNVAALVSGGLRGVLAK